MGKLHKTIENLFEIFPYYRSGNHASGTNVSYKERNNLETHHFNFSYNETKNNKSIKH